MKKFYYTVVNHPNRRRNNRTGSIYYMRGRSLEYIGDYDETTASTKGTKATVFNRLIELGFIPRKWYRSSVCEWRGPGYFDGPVTEHYSITELF